MTAIDITDKHSSTCELNKYVERHGGIDNLQIEDIRTLVQADQAVFPEMIPMTIPTKITDIGEKAASSTIHTEPQASTEDVLSVVTNRSLATSTTMHNVNADSTHTKTPLPVVTPPGPLLGQETVPAEMTATPLHVVTLHGPLLGQETLPAETTATPLHVVTASDSTIGSTTASTPLTVTGTFASETSKQLKWSRILNRPTEPMPMTETGGDDNKLPQPKSSGDPGQSTTADNPNTNLSDRYYEVLSPSQYDVLYISHMDIMNSRCTVQLEWLNKDSITSVETGTPTLPSESLSTESSDAKVPKKKPCYQPKRKPSRARVQAQQIITARKKSKKQLTFQSHNLPPAKQKKPDTGAPAEDSSDDTMFNSPISLKKHSYIHKLCTFNCIVNYKLRHLM